MDRKLIKSFWMNLGWSKQREVRIMTDGRAYFEVAEQGHCGICQGRIRNIENAVAENKLDVNYAYLHDRYPADAKTLWVGVMVDEKLTDSEIDTFLREQLNLPK